MAAIQELTIDEYVEGKGKDARPVRRTKIKLYDKRPALVEIGRELGLFGPKTQVPFAEQVRQMSAEQRMAHAASLAERADRILRAAGNLGKEAMVETSDAEYEEIPPKSPASTPS
jgi:hypothetical protein